MIPPIVAPLEDIHSGVRASRAFRISLTDQVHIMKVLRSTLYSDKILAVLREYSANAWDAHQQAGKPDVPISVALPTALAPNLVIRDFGSGLSEDDVLNVFTQYGESTKRGTNEQNGYLGIGGKSGFAYSDSFSITSHFGGTKCLYLAVLDSTGAGELRKLHESTSEETGLEVSIPVRVADISLFRAKAEWLFRYFRPIPVINADISPVAQDTDIGSIGNKYAEGVWVAVMGCIPYKLNTQQIHEELAALNIPSAVSRANGILRFGIGEISVTASREEIEWDDRTKQVVAAKFLSLTQALVARTIEKVSSEITLWEKRRAVLELREWNYNYVNYEELKPFSAAQILWPELGNFGLATSTGNPRLQTGAYLNVREDSRLIIRDENHRRLAGYKLSQSDTLLIPKTKICNIEVTTTELDTVLADMGITGIPVVLLSSLPWEPKQKVSTINRSMYGSIKYRRRSFVLDPSKIRHTPKSSMWEPVQRVAEDTDVYVPLISFVPYGSTGFDAEYDRIKVILDRIGVPMPPILGYKTLEDGSVPAPSGKDLRTWFLEVLKANLTDTLLKTINHYRLRLEITQVVLSHRYRSVDTLNIVRTYSKVLGVDHFVSKYLATPDLPKDAPMAFLAAVSGYIPAAKSVFLEELQSRYPLLADGWMGDFTARPAAIAEYIKAMDAYRLTVANGEKNE